MSCPFNDEQLAQLNIFVTLCKSHPTILNHPKLDFFKDYLVSLGVRIPTSVHTFETAPTAPSGDAAAKDADPAAESSGDESGMETDIELDMDGVIESEPADESQEMGDSLKEVSDEDQDKSDEKRMEAMKAFSEQQFDEAIKLYNEAIVMNPHSALLFAKRGQVYLKQNKLYSCIKDCSKALELNCDSAAAYKFRGRAYRLLGKFEEASHDLCESLKIDYDEQANDWLNEVKPNAEKLRQQKLTAQRKKEEKEHSEKVTRARKAQEARSEAAKAQAEGGKFPGAGAGAGAGGFKFPDKAFITPELMDLFSDPEISNAFWDMTSNPGNISKYQNNPKILAAMELLSGKMGGMGMPFMPGGGADAPADEPPIAEPKVGDDDVGLD